MDGGLNTYAYVYNNSLFRIDPLGLADADVTFSFGGQLGVKAKIYGLVGLDIGVNLGRIESHLIGEPSVSESYRLAVSAGKYSVGFKTERKALGRPIPMRRDSFGRPILHTGRSISDMLCDVEFETGPFISVGDASLRGDFVLEIGVNAVLGLDATVNLSQALRDLMEFGTRMSQSGK